MPTVLLEDSTDNPTVCLTPNTVMKSLRNWQWKMKVTKKRGIPVLLVWPSAYHDGYCKYVIEVHHSGKELERGWIMEGEYAFVPEKDKDFLNEHKGTVNTELTGDES